MVLSQLVSLETKLLT